MTKKIVTIKDNLQHLWDLQVIDSQIDNIKILKGALPIEVSDLEDEIHGLEIRISKLKDSVEAIDHEISNHQANIKNSQALIERYNKQLDDVKNNREFEALTKEIELQNLEIQLSEKKIREATEGKGMKQEILDSTSEKYDAKIKDLELKKKELDKIIEKTDKEENSLKRKSKKQRQQIPERLLRSYDKIRSRYKNGLAVVTHHRESCGGCFNRIPPQVQIELGMHKEIVACEHCGRVLVDHEIAGVTEDALS